MHELVLSQSYHISVKLSLDSHNFEGHFEENKDVFLQKQIDTFLKDILGKRRMFFFKKRLTQF